MIDSHAHIYLEDFKGDLEEVVSRALTSGVEKILMPNIDVDSIEAMLEVEAKYPQVCFPMMGLHPCSVKEDFRAQLEVVEQWFERRAFLAVGEIGTDLYWDKTFWKEQQQAFHFQCRLALSKNLPVVIHCRNSLDETIAMVGEHVGNGLRGVFHCFTGTVEQAHQITEMGFYVGLGGVSTFKNAGMDKVVPHIDSSKIILETDAPYLTPAPYRGKRNEPAYVTFVAEKVASYLELSKSSLVELTVTNTNELFFGNNSNH